VLTDGLAAYNGLASRGYIHTKTFLNASDEPAHVLMPGVHRVASLLKRWVLGTHQGSVTSDHLQSYLEEFTFRFNRRTSRSAGCSSGGSWSRPSSPARHGGRRRGGYDW